MKIHYGLNIWQSLLSPGCVKNMSTAIGKEQILLLFPLNCISFSPIQIPSIRIHNTPLGYDPNTRNKLACSRNSASALATDSSWA